MFRDDLKKNPRGGRSLFGLAEALEAQGKTDGAMLVRQEFNDAWRTAEIEPNLYFDVIRAFQLRKQF